MMMVMKLRIDKHDEPQHVAQGELTLPLLDCLGISC